MPRTTTNYATRAELQQVASEINAHERECAERYKHLEHQLSDGQNRFLRLENMLWGLYVLLITSALVPSLMTQVGGLTG